jgi:hypothetical protein
LEDMDTDGRMIIKLISKTEWVWTEFIRTGTTSNRLLWAWYLTFWLNKSWENSRLAGQRNRGTLLHEVCIAVHIFPC